MTARQPVATKEATILSRGSSKQREREREREAIERAEGDIECEEMRATERMKETSS